ncbi:MAG TPA: HK97-gp10 family putative phage morphogenesis protein [Actinoplanes sp.]
MVTVWFDGVDEMNTVRREMRAATGRVGALGAAVVRKSGLQVEATAKLFSPVDTGHLKATIGARFEGDGRHGEMEAVISATAEYARYQEFGTSRQAPQAFMGPALDRVAPGFVAACEALGGIIGGGSG